MWEGDSVRHTLADAQGAANFLLERWPQKKDADLYRIARQVALDALEGKASVETFRAALVAAEEIEILA